MDKDKALMIQPTGGQIEKLAMQAEDVLNQVNLIKKITKEVMEENVHYGRIPGTDKPTLLQPGAEKLILTFRLDPEIEILTEIEQPDFIAYKVKCTLFHIPTGDRVASGVGACNSREAKYRWKNDKVSTGKPIPKNYWDLFKAGKRKEAQDSIGGKNFGHIKENGKWYIASLKKIENDNPWDFQNTIFKMAVKRSKVAAALNATAAGDLFTQDVEDIPEEMINEENNRKKSGNSHSYQQRPPQQSKSSQQEMKGTQETIAGKNEIGNGNGGITSQKLCGMVAKIAGGEAVNLWKKYCYKQYGIQSLTELNTDQLKAESGYLRQASKRPNDFKKFLDNYREKPFDKKENLINNIKSKLLQIFGDNRDGLDFCFSNLDTGVATIEDLHKLTENQLIDVFNKVEITYAEHKEAQAHINDQQEALVN